MTTHFSVVRRTGVFLSFLAFFALGGGHLAVLQLVAWTGMMIEYSERAGLAQGISQTFDGKHPCRLCCKIEQARKQEKTTPVRIAALKKIGYYICVSTSHLETFLGVPFLWRTCSEFGVYRADQPPVPPPRSSIS